MALKTKKGAHLLWDGNPAVWDGIAPIMFPIVGRLVGDSYRVHNTIYRLPTHGFARSKQFSIVESSSSSVRFRLSWDKATMAIYPFKFVLDVDFTVSGFTLTMVMSVKNQGLERLPASFGFHPALRWPLPFSEPRSNHSIVFECEEISPVRRLNRQGVILPQLAFTPVEGRILQLEDKLFNDDALIFDNIKSRGLQYGTIPGPNIEIGFPDMPHLTLWTRPSAEFICIEPSFGFADPKGFSGDFMDKPGIFTLEPGETKQGTMSISLLRG